MLNVKKLIESAEACLGWPYVSPGSNDSNGIDCSGLLVKCFKDQGASIYHGSNTIYRKYCLEKGVLISTAQLIPGMVVFKWNDNTPEKFNDGQGDFQHVGLVVDINPLRIIHASSAVGCVTTDTKLGKWAYWGRLKDVEYTSSPASVLGQIEQIALEPRISYINTDKVNFRVGPSTSKPRIEYLNTGDVVEVLGESGSWLKCKWNDRTGYVQTRFVDDEPTALEDSPAVEIVGEDAVVNENTMVWLQASNGGRVNIREGNGLNYGKITSVQSGTALPYIATAQNGWYAVKIKNAVGWVSPEYGSLGVG